MAPPGTTHETVGGVARRVRRAFQGVAGEQIALVGAVLWFIGAERWQDALEALCLSFWIIMSWVQTRKILRLRETCGFDRDADTEVRIGRTTTRVWYTTPQVASDKSREAR